MPIRFRCEHCRQRLTVSERKAGAKAACPKCHEQIRIPQADGAVGAVEEAAGGDAETGEESTDAELMGREEDGEFVWSQDEWFIDDGAPVGQYDPTRVSVSRHTLFMQGVLIAAVGVVALVLGVMIGQLTAPKTANLGPNPCTVTGSITLAKQGRDSFPDIGCVVLALPVDQRPNRTSKITIDSLRPGTPTPERTDASLIAIRALGGDYSRADANGRFQLNLPDHGKYFVLFVSNNADRSAGQELDKRDLMQMGNYLLYPNDLLGKRQYVWKEQSIERSKRIDMKFERL